MKGIEHDPAPHPYGETLTELLNYDVTPYEHTLSALKQAMEEKDAQAAPRAFMDAVRDLSSLPYFRLFLSDLRQFNELPVECFVVGEARAAFEAYILSDGKKDAAYMREQAGAVRFIQERYAWFLTEAVQQRAFEKKKGQRPSRPASSPAHTLTGPRPGAARTLFPTPENLPLSWRPFSCGQSIFYRPAGGWPRSRC